MSKPLRVLIVEDSEDDRLLLLRALKQSGFAVADERVETAETMHDVLESGQWDVVISDYNLPHFNALEALAVLKQSGRDLPFLIVSGTITEDMAVAGMRAGAHDYLMKGNLARLGPAIDRELQEAANRRQRREAEHQLQESSERFRATFNQAAVGIGHASLEGQWLLVNQKLGDILGYSPDELLQLNVKNVAHPEDYDTERPLYRQLLAGEIQNYSLEKRNIRKDGSIVWVHLTVSGAKNPAGELEYVIRVIEDITVRKHAEAEIRSLNTRLQQAMTETHHRVKNSLQIIASMIEMHNAMDEDFSSLVLRRLSRSVRTLAAVHDLLTNQAKQDGEANWISSKEILEKLLPLLQDTASDRRIGYHVEDVLLPTHQGTSLALITNELVSNALKHSKGRVDVVFCKHGEEARLVVSDDGAGFPAGFDPSRAANTGLELVENLTRLDLDGTSRYENNLDHGAQVTIEMPLPAYLGSGASFPQN